MPQGTELAPRLWLRVSLWKGAFVNKLYIATCAILVPLVGCTGMVGDNTTVLESGGGGVLAAGGSSGASHAAGGSAGAGTGLGSGSGTAAGGGSGSGSGSVTAAGAGGVTATGGATSAGGSSNGGACSVAVLPAGVQTMLANKCATCHGSTPLSGLPSLVSYADLTAPSK